MNKEAVRTLLHSLPISYSNKHLNCFNLVVYFKTWKETELMSYFINLKTYNCFAFVVKLR